MGSLWYIKVIQEESRTWMVEGVREKSGLPLTAIKQSRKKRTQRAWVSKQQGL